MSSAANRHGDGIVVLRVFSRRIFHVLRQAKIRPIHRKNVNRLARLFRFGPLARPPRAASDVRFSYPRMRSMISAMSSFVMA